MDSRLGSLILFHLSTGWRYLGGVGASGSGGLFNLAENPQSPSDGAGNELQALAGERGH